MSDVCLVVPCFNEAARLNVADFLAHLDASPRSSFCFVNDGSTDQTAAALKDLASRDRERILVLSLARNAGKAEAVRQGVLHVAQLPRFEVAGYWDADLATPLSELARMLETLDQSPGCQLVLGSRWRHLGSNIERRAWRHAVGRVFSTAASLVLDMTVYDSQCGAKIFRTALAAVLFEEPFITRWLFDVELLARLRQHHPHASMHTVAIESPLRQWRDVSGSQLRLLQMATVPAGLLAIHRRYRQR